jgi:hypothetical protein
MQNLRRIYAEFTHETRVRIFCVNQETHGLRIKYAEGSLLMSEAADDQKGRVSDI